MNESVRLCAVGALALTIAACGTHQAADEGAADSETRPQVAIEVQNQNFYDSRVYVVEVGRTTRQRLGNVPGTDIRVSPGDELVLSVTATTHQLRFRG
jgi:hypothetical protein